MELKKKRFVSIISDYVSHLRLIVYSDNYSAANINTLVLKTVVAKNNAKTTTQQPW